MNPLRTLATNTRNLRRTFDQVVLDIVQEDEQMVLDMNREQMYSGIRSDGTRIEPEYTATTISIKQRKGQPTDRVTLKDTGDHYREMFIQYGDDSFGIYSDAEYAIDLANKYEFNIYGLTPDNISILGKVVGDKLEDRLDEILLKDIRTFKTAQTA